MQKYNKEVGVNKVIIYLSIAICITGCATASKTTPLTGKKDIVSHAPGAH